jgi:hypothetical protein
MPSGFSLPMLPAFSLLRKTRQTYPPVRNVEYSILLVMSELSTMQCDRALGLWLLVHGRQVSMGKCRGGAVADGLCGGRR